MLGGKRSRTRVLTPCRTRMAILLSQFIDKLCPLKSKLLQPQRSNPT
jgi:hypothetical protein